MTLLNPSEVSREKNNKVRPFTKKISDMSQETFENYYEMLCDSEAMEDTDDNDRKRLRKALVYLWSL